MGTYLFMTGIAIFIGSRIWPHRRTWTVRATHEPEGVEIENGLWMSPEGRRLLEAAQAEAREYEHDVIGELPILIALTRESDADVRGTFAKLFVDPERVRWRAKEALTLGTNSDRDRPLSFSTHAGHALRLALAEARARGFRRVRPVDVLTGLLQAGGAAAGVVESLVDRSAGGR